MIDRLFSIFLLCLFVGAPVAIACIFSADFLLEFVFFWPLLMSALWMTGGIYFWFFWERHWPQPRRAVPPVLKGNPLVSILVPCFNEQDNVRATLQAALSQNYRNTEVIAINDGSSDTTGAVLEALAKKQPKLRVIHLAQNQGKAMALRMGALAARSDYLVCIDGDALLSHDACAYLAAPLVHFPRVGAVTGNPRVRTRSTLIGRIQVGEFSSIIGLTKRAQRVYGQVFTVSGVVVAFRRSALDRVGYWSLDMITEDIDISWKLQRDHWSIFYEPRAICWILMPETLAGLCKQRLRWAQGGAEVFVKNVGNIWRWPQRRLWPIVAEFCLSTLWSFAFATSMGLWAVGQLVLLPERLRVDSVLPSALTGLALSCMCILQFLTSVAIERHYEKGLFKALFWVVWYPLVYWLLSLVTTLVSFPKVMLRRQRQRARWTSPDRGIALAPPVPLEVPHDHPK